VCRNGDDALAVSVPRMPRMQIAAEAVVGAPPARVFAFLSDLRNHWRLEGRFVALDALDADARGGRVRMAGPLGIGRTAVTRVVDAEPDTTLRGIAELGGGTRAAVHWDIAPHDGGSRSRVTLAATVERASLLDRLLLLVGGRSWLERLFASALRRLGDEVAAE
jgi:uncharacterized protein YndB with AHSA1/START domain